MLVKELRVQGDRPETPKDAPESPRSLILSQSVELPFKSALNEIVNTLAEE